VARDSYGDDALDRHAMRADVAAHDRIVALAIVAFARPQA
jgi:hypothetical protein